MKKMKLPESQALSYLALALVIFLFSKIEVLATNGGPLSVIFMAINAIIFFSHLKGENFEEKRPLLKTLAIMICVMPFFFFSEIQVLEKLLIIVLFITNIIFVVTEAFTNWD